MRDKIVHENPVESLGFAQVPHAVTRDTRLSDGAYRTYVHLLEFAQQRGAVWAAHETIASNRNLDMSTITRHKRELVSLNYIEIEKRKNLTSILVIKSIALNGDVVEIARLTLEKRNSGHGKNAMSYSGHGKNDMTGHGKNDMTGHGKNDMLKNNNHEEEQMKKNHEFSNSVILQLKAQFRGVGWEKCRAALDGDQLRIEFINAGDVERMEHHRTKAEKIINSVVGRPITAKFMQGAK